MRTEFLKREHVCERLPERLQRLGPQALRSFEFVKNAECFVAPEKLGHGVRVLVGVWGRGADSTEANQPASLALGCSSAPPVRRGVKDVGNVARACDDRHPVEYSAIDLSLPGEPVEAIAVTLDLESLDAPVDDGEIDACGVQAQLKFLDHHRLGVVGVKAAEFEAERMADVEIAQRVAESVTRVDRSACVGG